MLAGTTPSPSLSESQEFPEAPSPLQTSPLQTASLQTSPLQTEPITKRRVSFAQPLESSQLEPAHPMWFPVCQVAGQTSYNAGSLMCSTCATVLGMSIASGLIPDPGAHVLRVCNNCCFACLLCALVSCVCCVHLFCVFAVCICFACLLCAPVLRVCYASVHLFCVFTTCLFPRFDSQAASHPSSVPAC